MKKLTLIILTLTIMVSLAACNDNSDNVIVDTPQNSADTTTSSVDESESSSSSSISIKGVCGEDITAVDFLKEHSDQNFGDLPFLIYTYEGFGYYSPSDGSGGVKPDCESFNEEPFIERPTLNYQHIDVGDNISGLELISASGMLFDTDGEISLEQQELRFSGSLTLKGYLHLSVGDVLYSEEDDLLFYPSAEEWKNLPYNSKNCGTEYLGEDYDFYWCANAPVIHLGKVSDRYYSEITEVSNNPKEVTVTISDIVLRCCFTDMFFGDSSRRNSAVLDAIVFG